MYDRIPIQLWMLLPREHRAIIADALNLPKTGVSEIRDNEVLSDGYNVEDLSNITIEKMLDFIGGSEDESFHRLWELTCAKARYMANPPPVTEEALDLANTDVPTKTKRNAKKTKADASE